MTDDPIDVEVVEDETGDRPTTAALARIEPSRLDIIQPIASADHARAVFQEYLQVRKTIVVADDIHNIQGKQYVKKSGWRKLAVVMGVSNEIVSRSYDRDEQGRIVRAEVVCRAIAPNGRSWDGLGVCDFRERCCPVAYGEECKNKAQKHYHCAAGCNGFTHFSKPQHDIPATASTRATNRACSDLFGFGEVSAEEITDNDEPAERATIDAFVAAMNGIADDTQRKGTKNAYKERFGHPDQLTKGNVDAVRRFLTAAGATIPDPAPSPGPSPAQAGPSDGPSDGGSSGLAGAGTEAVAVGNAATPPPAPPSPAADDVPDAAGETPPPGAAQPTARAARGAAPIEQPSTAQQRRSIGMAFRELVANGIARQEDKAEVVGILTRNRVASTVDMTHDEAAKFQTAIRLIELGDIAIVDDPNLDGSRALASKTKRAQDFLAPYSDGEGSS